MVAELHAYHQTMLSNNMHVHVNEWHGIKTKENPNLANEG